MNHGEVKHILHGAHHVDHITASQIDYAACVAATTSNAIAAVVSLAAIRTTAFCCAVRPSVWSPSTAWQTPEEPCHGSGIF